MAELLQSQILSLLVLLAGFFLLTKSADSLVTGAGSMARRWGISSLVIGLTIVAFGTSAPEFFVNITSSFEGRSGITLGNIIGSNLANLLLGIGIIALINPIKIKQNTAWKEIPFMVLASFLLWSSASDFLLDGVQTAFVSRSEAIMLIALFLLFMVYTFGIAKVKDQEEEKVPVFSLGKSIGLFLFGVLGLAIGGKLVVSAASTLAAAFGLSETLIGITIVALGTSIPDILTSIVAARKQHFDLAVGNIVGSNIFNILWVLGTSALIRPIPATVDIQIDLWLVVGSALLFFLFQLTKLQYLHTGKLSQILIFRKKRYEIDRFEGTLFIAIYLLYMVFLIWRG